MGERASARRVVVVAFPQVNILDVAGPSEVFNATSLVAAGAELGGSEGYEIELIATVREPSLETSSGIRLLAHSDFARCRGPIDTLLVAGGPGVWEAAKDEELLKWLRRTAPRVRRLGSVCTGAFVLAAAGLLDGRRATTHWERCEQLAREFPKIDIDLDSIFVRDGNVSTSAGVTAGMDLALAFVEEDFGREVALRVARKLVMFLQRPGGQSQFSSLLHLQAADREPLRALQTWVVEHLAEDLSNERLAERVWMSPRNFARVFRREVGVTPARFIERLRVEAARRRLEESAGSIEQVARECGFGSADSMRRSFVRVIRVPPSDYRARFQSEPPAAPDDEEGPFGMQPTMTS
ncbi:GlxA family transcriptional regulator [Singulisphaera sp. GP187]|uniref:GlxA family transcriptional regulator n=1 Tax=Singulisphaera sp. GP187 TaxID=1882752 RepID=UPI0020B1329F|nr:GlxA family transcriptional regulator [Singulisphaera sp. GP187]